MPTQPYIYVEGQAEIGRPPDMVTLRFEVAARDPSQARANEEVQSKATKILSLLDEKKIAEKDVIAGDLHSEAEYQGGNQAGERRTFTGYLVTRSFTVKVREVGIFPKLVNELLSLGVENFSGIDPGLADEKKLQAQVWDKALSDAKERANQTAQAAGMKIDSVFALSPVAFPEISSRIFGSGGGMQAYSMSAPERKLDASQYRLAPITISQRIHVIYLISPSK